MFGQRRAMHEGEHQKARFLARRRAPKSTIFGTKVFGTRESTGKHDFVHEGKHSKQRSPKIERNPFFDCYSY